MTKVIIGIVLFVIFLGASIANFPGGKGIDIHAEGISSLSDTKGKRFVLREGTYSVLNEFDEYVTRSSTFYYPITYYYFNVLITDAKGEQFIMAVRTGKKTTKLRNSRSVKLYGMVSSLKEEKRISQSQSLGYGNTAETYSLCLNDNDDTVAGQYAASLLFAVLAILDLFLMMKLFKK